MKTINELIENYLSELSNNLLYQAQKSAADKSRLADKLGDTPKANKYFKKVVKFAKRMK